MKNITTFSLHLLILAILGVLPNCLQAQNRPEYTIYRADIPIWVDGRLDEPAWTSAPDVGKFVFPWYKNGKKEQTVAKLLWDDKFLYVAFICEDAHIWAEHTKRNSQVYLDDAVEVFTSPDPERQNVYFNIEMNVLGIFIEGFHPRGPDAQTKEEWDSEGVEIKTSVVGTLNDDRDNDSYWILEMAIPFKNFLDVAKNIPPKQGDIWHLNLNRLGGSTNQQYSQWSASQTPKPAYHVPMSFGRVTFSDRASPFWR